MIITHFNQRHSKQTGTQSCPLPQYLKRAQIVGELYEGGGSVLGARDDESAVIVNPQTVKWVVGDLNAERGIRLLENDVPYVQRPVHLRGEVNARPRRAPTGVSKVML